MRLTHLALLGASSLMVVACTEKATTPPPGGAPTHTPSPKPDTGGPCGDGTVLSPGTHCP